MSTPRCGRRVTAAYRDAGNSRHRKAETLPTLLASTFVQPNGPRLIVEPDDGHDPVRDFIASAETSLLVKQFTFTDDTLITAVIDRKNAQPAARGRRGGRDRLLRLRLIAISAR